MKKEEKKLLDWEARGNLNNSGDFHSSLTLDELEEMLLVENGGEKRDWGEEGYLWQWPQCSVFLG